MPETQNNELKKPHCKSFVKPRGRLQIQILVIKFIVTLLFQNFISYNDGIIKITNHSCF